MDFDDVVFFGKPKRRTPVTIEIVDHRKGSTKMAKPEDRTDNPNKAGGRETAPGQNKVFTNPTTGETRTGTMGQFNKENWADEGFEAPVDDAEGEAPVAEPTA
jgi:hypothetical protein